MHCYIDYAPHFSRTSVSSHALRGQPLPAFGAPAIDELAATFCGHTGAKTVGARTLQFTGLKSSFHGCICLIENRCCYLSAALILVVATAMRADLCGREILRSLVALFNGDSQSIRGGLGERAISPVPGAARADWLLDKPAAGYRCGHLGHAIAISSVELTGPIALRQPGCACCTQRWRASEG